MYNNNYIYVLYMKLFDKSNIKINLIFVVRKLLINYLIYIILRRGIILQFKKRKEKNLICVNIYFIFVLFRN